MRANTAETEFRYAFGGSGYAAAQIAKASQSYNTII